MGRHDLCSETDSARKTQSARILQLLSTMPWHTMAARANVLLQALPGLGSAAVHLEWVCHPFRSCDPPSGDTITPGVPRIKKSLPKWEHSPPPSPPLGYLLKGWSEGTHALPFKQNRAAACKLARIFAKLRTTAFSCALNLIIARYIFCANKEVMWHDRYLKPI